LKYKLRDFINLKSAIAGAIIMGGMVFCVNYSFGWAMAGTAALKQATYTFLLGGIFVRISEVLSVKTKNKWLGIALGTLVSSCITISAVYGMHVMKGTPLPYESTLPTIFFAPPGFIFLAWIYRTKMDKKKGKERQFSEV
jgi:hypothetical protein